MRFPYLMILTTCLRKGLNNFYYFRRAEILKALFKLQISEHRYNCGKGEQVY